MNDFKTLLYNMINLNLDIQTVGLLFPAISLLFLAYTNRFLATGQLIRSLGSNIKNGKSKQIRDQLRNLKKRLELIRIMQLYGAISLFLDTFALLFLALDFKLIGVLFFYSSVISMIYSLFNLIIEIYISTIALNIELKTMNGYNESNIQEKENVNNE